MEPPVNVWPSYPLKGWLLVTSFGRKKWLGKDGCRWMWRGDNHLFLVNFLCCHCSVGYFDCCLGGSVPILVVHIFHFLRKMECKPPSSDWVSVDSSNFTRKALQRYSAIFEATVPEGKARQLSRFDSKIDLQKKRGWGVWNFFIIFFHIFCTSFPRSHGAKEHMIHAMIHISFPKVKAFVRSLAVIHVKVFMVAGSQDQRLEVWESQLQNQLAFFFNSFYFVFVKSCRNLLQNWLRWPPWWLVGAEIFWRNLMAASR